MEIVENNFDLDFFGHFSILGLLTLFIENSRKKLNYDYSRFFSSIVQLLEEEAEL